MGGVARSRAARHYQSLVLGYLDEGMREFLGDQQMMFLSTSDGGDAPDGSFRSGPPGFVRAVDERTVAWPEYCGGTVTAPGDLAGDPAGRPGLGLLFVDLFRDVVGLHLRGRAAILTPEAIAACHPGFDPRSAPDAAQWVTVQIDEAHLHRARHLPRLVTLG